MDENERFKARMIKKHKPAFSLWQRCQEILEAVVEQRRGHLEPYAAALDLLFVQAFKSHGSIGVLCEIGQGEDAATIARRILEILFQAGYLAADGTKRDERGKRYLAWFWSQADRRIKANLPEEVKQRWRNEHKAHEKYLTGKRLYEFPIETLAKEAKLSNLYRDYRYLSQAVHCTAPGMMLGWDINPVQIRTTGPEISVLLTRSSVYMIVIAGFWNQCFGLIDEETRRGLLREAMKFKPRPDGAPSSS